MAFVSNRNIKVGVGRELLLVASAECSNPNTHGLFSDLNKSNSTIRGLIQMFSDVCVDLDDELQHSELALGCNGNL